MRSTSRCRGVGSSSVRPSRRATLPISVAMPVAVTTAAATPAGDGGAVEHHVHAVAQGRRLGERSDVLEHRLALAGERRLRHRERGRLDQPGVGAHRVALGQQQRRRPARRRPTGRAPRARRARHAGRRRRHALQRRDRLLGARLLHVAEHGVEHDDHRDHDDLERHALRVPRRPRRRATRRRRPAAGRSSGSANCASSLRHVGTGRPASSWFGPYRDQAGGRLGRRQPSTHVGVQLGGDVEDVTAPGFELRRGRARRRRRRPWSDGWCRRDAAAVSRASRA